MPTEHSTPDRETLIHTLEPALATQFGLACRIERLDRRLSDYHSSFAIEQIDVAISDGRKLSMMFKNLSPQGLLEEARRTRPSHFYEPRRELRVYRELLSRYSLGTAVCYAAVEDSQLERYWLFLEKVPGLELYQIGDFYIWEQVARWLGRFHRLAPQLLPYTAQVGLWNWSRERYWACLEQAAACVRSRPGFGEFEGEAMQRIANVYDRVVTRLESLPPVVIHGEFYASNILVQEATSGLRICPIDWETAGVGPGLIDLAALVAGEWTEPQRAALALAYRQGEGHSEAKTQMSDEESRVALTCCQLHLAVQLLGRSPDWKPPAEHSRDWLREAVSLTEQLPWS